MKNENTAAPDAWLNEEKERVSCILLFEKTCLNTWKHHNETKGFERKLSCIEPNKQRKRKSQSNLGQVEKALLGFSAPLISEFLIKSAPPQGSNDDHGQNHYPCYTGPNPL